MASDATVTVDDEVSTTPARLVPAAAGRPDVVEHVTGAACAWLHAANALAQVAQDVVEGGLQGVVTSRPCTVAILAEAIVHALGVDGAAAPSAGNGARREARQPDAKADAHIITYRPADLEEHRPASYSPASYGAALSL